MDYDSEALKILPVQDPPNEKTKPLNPILPQPPSLLLMISPIRTGKSTLISNLLLNSNFFGQDFFDEVFCISPTIYNDKTSRFLRKAFSCHDAYSDELVQGIIQGQEAFEDNMENQTRHRVNPRRYYRTDSERVLLESFSVSLQALRHQVAFDEFSKLSVRESRDPKQLYAYDHRQSLPQ